MAPPMPLQVLQPVRRRSRRRRRLPLLLAAVAAAIAVAATWWLALRPHHGPAPEPRVAASLAGSFAAPARSSARRRPLDRHDWGPTRSPSPVAPIGVATVA